VARSHLYIHYYGDQQYLERRISYLSHPLAWRERERVLGKGRIVTMSVSPGAFLLRVARGSNFMVQTYVDVHPPEKMSVF